MRLNEIRLTGLSTISLPIQGADPNAKFVFKGADGLGPSEIDVIVAGGKLQKKTPRNKELVFRIGLNPDWAAGQSVGEVRNEVYGLLSMPNNAPMTVTLIIDRAPYTIRIQGHVKKVEPALFSKSPEIFLTIGCMDSYFSGVTSVIQSFNNVNVASVNNVGTAPAGMYLTFNLASSAEYFSITDQITGERFRVDYSFLAGDELTIDTRDRTKSVSRYREDGVYVDLSLLHKRTDDSVWLQLHRPGLNTFTIKPNPVSRWQVIHTPLFWGV
jgi:hypothetical protein